MRGCDHRARQLIACLRKGYGSFMTANLTLLHVCYWHLADIAMNVAYVRFWPEADIRQSWGSGRRNLRPLTPSYWSRRC